MGFDLNRLDRIGDFDEILEVLEPYVDELLEEFSQSPEAEAYLKVHPKMEDYIGSWIDHLLYFGCSYEGVTLTKMTAAHAEAIVTQLFPQKVSLTDPDQANTIVPELIALFEYLQRTYKLRHAKKILKRLHKIQPKVPGLMTDPKNFGMAKSFFSSGMEAGFDMTSEEGVKAFQEQYNQGIREGTQKPLPLPNLPNLSPSSPTPDIPDNLLDDMPPELHGFAKALWSAMDSAPKKGDFELPNLSQMLLRQEMGGDREQPPLSEEAIALLKAQTISATQPGTLLTDFQMLLDFIGTEGMPVSGKHNLIPLKLLSQINEQLSEPHQLDLKRPVQKSFPTINGLYLLLRAIGLGQILRKGKKAFLKIDPHLHELWNSLNSTEQYFTLLEAWWIRASEDILGDNRGGPLPEGMKCFRAWSQIGDKGKQYSSYSDQQMLNYFPGSHNIGLLHLFGFWQVTPGKPDKGKGWRVKRVQRLPFGDAMLQLLQRAFHDSNYLENMNATWKGI